MHSGGGGGGGESILDEFCPCVILKQMWSAQLLKNEASSFLQYVKGNNSVVNNPRAKICSCSIYHQLLYFYKLFII